MMMIVTQLLKFKPYISVSFQAFISDAVSSNWCIQKGHVNKKAQKMTTVSTAFEISTRNLSIKNQVKFI